MQKPRKTKVPAPSGGLVRDPFVVGCITVVAVATGVALHLQLGLAVWMAVVAASAFYVAMLSAHLIVRRSQQIDDLRHGLSRLEDKLARGSARVSSHHAPSGDRMDMPALASVSAPPPGAPAVPAPAELSVTGGHEQSHVTAAAVAEDYWKFSPVAAQSEPAPPRLAPIAPMAAPQWDDRSPDVTPAPTANMAMQSAPAHQDTGSDADHINAVIKKIAADITQGQAAIAQTTAAREPKPADVDSSIAALQAVADAMRVSGFSVDEKQPEPAAMLPMLPHAPQIVPIAIRNVDGPSRERLAAVAEAIERERFDVMLEPILGLGDLRAQHYTVSIRMRSEADQATAEAAEKFTARGEGLLPLLDAVKVERAARVAWRMEDRGKAGALFSQLSGESLVSDRFLNRFAGTYRQGDTLGSRLILTFRQRELRNFSELQWSTVRDMADLGFRFCIEDVTDLDIDFEALATAGFTFAKLDAAVFLNGLPAAGGAIPAADICRHFAGLNLAVIVGGISDDAVSATLKAYGVELGQGRLFGTPRPVKSDVLRDPQAAVA